MKSNYSKALEKLETDILLGKYKQRERFIELDVMDKYGVTRSAVRKIFKELEFKGLVSYVPNRGVHVAEVESRDAQELYAIRLLLENFATDLVFSRVNKTHIAHLVNINKKYQEAVKSDNFADMMKLNNKFHQSIIEICGNEFLIDIINQVRNRVRVIRHCVWLYPEHVQRSIEGHEALLEALQNKDSAKFKRIYEVHVMPALDMYTKINQSNII
jgi:DNA-binding GntR family transcriptional regulator